MRDFYKSGITPPFTKKPIVLGHENCGTVYQVGEGVTKFKVGDRVLCGPPAHCPEDCEPYCIYSCVKPGGQVSIVGTIQSPMETIVPGQIAGAEPNLQFSFTYTQKDTGRRIRKKVYIKPVYTDPFFRKSKT